MVNREARVELKGSARAIMPGGQDIGPADPNQQIEVTVYLRGGSGVPPNIRRISALPNSERKYLTREEFAQSHGARSEDLAKIRAFAAKYGLQVTDEDTAARRVKLSGSVQAFNQAFGVELRHYRHLSGLYRCRTGSISVP